MKTVDIKAELRAHIARKYITQREAAKAWGVSPGFISSVLNGRKAPTEVMLEDAGFSSSKVYLKKSNKGAKK